MKDNKESILRHIDGLNQRLEKRLNELRDMQLCDVKFQLQQGTKDDIYRLKREIAELQSTLPK